MTRTRSGKKLTERLVMLAVLLGLAGMFGHTLQKVHAAASRARRGAVADYSASASGARRAGLAE